MVVPAMLLELPLFGRWAVVVFIYVFVMLLLLVAVTTFAQYLKLQHKMPNRQFSFLVVGMAGAIYVLLVFYVLNEWAERLIAGY